VATARCPVATTKVQSFEAGRIATLLSRKWRVELADLIARIQAPRSFLSVKSISAAKGCKKMSSDECKLTLARVQSVVLFWDGLCSSPSLLSQTGLTGNNYEEVPISRPPRQHFVSPSFPTRKARH
jgi:hypothetical protein